MTPLARISGRRRLPLLVVGLVLLFQPLPASAAENYAFLVAVGEYDRKELKPLQYTRNDILELHQLLLDSGYDKSNVVLMHDDQKSPVGRRFFPESSKIREELRLLLAGLEKDDTLIVAFSGHGVQFKGEKGNYFCPADVKLDDRKTLIAVTEIYQALEKCPARQKLLLVDACRDDPQSALSRARQSVDLESVTRPQSEAVPEGLVAVFSCAAGQRSFEDPDLKHGIFFYHVLQALGGSADDGDEEVTLDELVSFTKKKTQSFARTSFAAVQTPQQLGDFTGTWVLRKLKAGEAVATTKPKPNLPITSLPNPPRTAPPTTKPPVSPPTRPTTPPPGANSTNEKIFQNTVGMEMIRIPSGDYMRGSPTSDSDSYGHERPQHRVRITKDFYIGMYEVTQGEWFDIMKTKPWEDRPNVQEGRDVAASWINWEEANEFCQKLSEKEGRTYRLPTEAEWEYACRADSTTIRPYGDLLFELREHSRYGSTLTEKGNTEDEQYAGKVGTKKPNKFGLFDMLGNVREWCGDWVNPAEYTQFEDKAAIDPQGLEQPLKDYNEHRIRGGSWYQPPYAHRSAHRDGAFPKYRFSDLGFRVVAPAAAAR